MHQAIIKYYRQLLRDDFPHSGELADASVCVEAVGEKMVHCGNAGNYMRLYFNVEDECITVMRYICSCEPVANVAVEVMCEMAEGKSLDEAGALPENLFYERVGCREADAELRLKAQGLLELLREGIANYRHADSGKKASGVNMQWDLLGRIVHQES